MWTLLLSRLSQPGVFIDKRQVDSGEIRIGRSADKADWVIADPEGHLSRHHCTIAAVGLDLFVIDTSTNGVALNDPARRVSPQQPVAIRMRDRLLLGDYAIEVAPEGAGAGMAMQSAPVADFPIAGRSGLSQPDAWFDGSVDPIWGVGAPSAEVHEFLGNAMHDFLGGSGSGGGYKPAADPWAGPMSDAFSKPILSAVAPAQDAFAIPEDWASPARKQPARAADPFGAFGGASGAEPFGMPPAKAFDPFAATPPRGTDPFGGGRGQASDPFASPPPNDPFGSSAGSDPFGQTAPANDPFAGFAPPGGSNPFVDPLHDPFASPPRQAGTDPFATPVPDVNRDPFAQAPGAAESDPFSSFDQSKAAGPPPASERDPFALPARDFAHDPFELPAAPSGIDPFAMPSADDLKAGVEAATAEPMGNGMPSPTIDPFADYVPAAATETLAGISTDPSASLAGAPPPGAAVSAGQPDAGWAAFCEGAGLKPEEMRGSPDAMRRLGTLYRQVVLGLSDLIQDRAAFKDEFRVERTQLSFGKNNPMKHLPALESAKLLLGDPLPGFMPADEAVRSGFEDVKKHQLAMLAGVQHALTAVFERLAPAEIERIMKKAAGERKGLPFSRGVNPWTVYQTVFDALRLDAASNVNSVMSVAFREGYETFLKKAK